MGGWVWVGVGGCGWVWVCVGVCGCVWVCVGVCGCVWVCVGVCGCVCGCVCVWRERAHMVDYSGSYSENRSDVGTWLRNPCPITSKY